MTSPFRHNLDSIWEPLNFASKRDALRRVKRTFREGIDFKEEILRRVASKPMIFKRVSLTDEGYSRTRAIAPLRFGSLSVSNPTTSGGQNDD
jgi:hypothetical protein